MENLMQPPLHQHFPASGGGALEGQILTDEEIREMDRRIIWTVLRRPTLPVLPPYHRPERLN
jgi:hypothetical protein